jgi:hypothetical protein
MAVEAAQITDKTSMIAILEIQGVRCTSKSFCVDVEMKQLMVMKPSDLFDSCIILKGRAPPPVEKHLAKTADPVVFIEDNTVGQEDGVFNQNLIILEDEPNQENTTDPIIIADNEVTDNEVTNSEVLVTDNEVLVADNEVLVTDNEVLVTNNEATDNEALVTNNEVTNNEVTNNEVTNNDADYLGFSDVDDILEVNLDVNEIDAADTFQLKDKKEVYYEMYREALQKAKAAKAVALTEFMEARRIKNLYMLKDLNDSDDESDLDDLDDLSEDDE